MKLIAAQLNPDESLTEVVSKGQRDKPTITAGELRARGYRQGPTLSKRSLDKIEALKLGQDLPRDKWAD